ncbi:aminotransferase DegT [Paenibacillus riograndensis]|uniref:Aminotransferase DegT n=1 Tax=Paenibacillus riograndensis TaxID=483937 RepID=A0A132TR13_9BACL|nr:LegC family aminotransferase [Paenibacillus riograndensis]KWX73798.1 aminotransferase DegT [Paenibacillus riograndensis]
MINNTDISDRIVAIFQKMLSNETKNVLLHEPAFKGNEWTYIKECLDTGWVSSVGAYVDRFEKDLAQFTGSPYAVAVVNGTAALHISLLIAGVQPNDEVMIPSLTFVATANAVTYCGATPHLIDVTHDTLGVDAIKLGDYLKEIAIIQQNGHYYNKYTGRRLSAVVPMHTFGHPVDLEGLLEVCNRYHLALVEDAAESLGSYYKGKHTGTYGHIAALSFNGNKIITTGGGGAILTANEEWAKRAKHLTTTAKIPHRWLFIHDETAYNYRLPNLNAALGCAQLEQLPLFLEQKRKLANLYAQEFKQIPELTFVKEPTDTSSNYWLNTLKLNTPDSSIRDEILKKTNDHGFMTRPTWTPMHKLEIYKSSPQMDLSVTEEIASSVINIPSSPALLNSATKEE